MLTIITFLIIILAGSFFYILSLFGIERRSVDRFEVQQKLVEKANALYTMLLEDETPEVDHLFDEAWLYARENPGVDLRDISSYLNPNWIDRKMLQYLNNYMLEPPETLLVNPVEYSLEDFINFREKYGILSNISETFGNFFSKETIDAYFTEYNYFGFNVTYQFVFGTLYGARMNNPDLGQGLMEKYQQYLLGQVSRWQSSADATIIHSAQGLESWFFSNGYSQSDFDLLFPIINTEPVMNIHHVPEEILKGILSYPDYHIGDAAGKAEKFIKQREENENGLTESTFDTILGAIVKKTYPANRIWHYFGLKTWFWEITAYEGEAELHWVLARIPPRRFGDKPEYKLIKEEFTFTGVDPAGPLVSDENAEENGEVPGEELDENFEPAPQS